MNQVLQDGSLIETENDQAKGKAHWIPLQT